MFQVLPDKKIGWHVRKLVKSIRRTTLESNQVQKLKN